MDRSHRLTKIRLIYILVASLVLLIQFTLQLGADKHNLGYVYWRNATKRTRGSVVPMPKYIKFTREEDYFKIDPLDFHIELAKDVENCRIVSLARDRYYRDNLLFDDQKPEDKDAIPVKGHSLGALNELVIRSSVGQQFGCELIPSDDMDEAYNLTIGTSSSYGSMVGGAPMAILSARSNWGIVRGLETLSQLIVNLNRNSYAVRPVQVIDEPRFKYRGFMLDTARHYVSLEKILDLLDAMSYNKLNVFHWHMVDDQSFPFESKTYPQLSERSSYKPELVYTHQDVQLILLYAAMRGIRVVPELDTPGHSYTLRHLPNVLTECYDPKTGKQNGDFGPVDPTKASAYKTLNRLLDELKSLFPDPYFHAGGDEVDFDCWRSNPNINRWMAARNMSHNYEELTNYYIRRLHNMVAGHNKTMLVWQEVYDLGADLPKQNAIIHVWKDINNKPGYMAELAKVIGSGYRALLSSCWYLNYIDYGQDWTKFYHCDPADTAYIHSDVRHLVLGGEICMWTEFVDDTNVVQRTWPRASAAAERLWSPSSVTDVGEFLNRLEQHRCRLMSRGIQAEPVNGPGYC